MRILFVADTHGNQDLEKIGPNVVKDLALDKNDYIIHCGDIGTPWLKDFDQVLGFSSNLPCQVIICLGNHENYNWIQNQPLIKRYGVYGYLMAANLFAPKIGSVVKLKDKTFWFYPGGYSIDYQKRQLNKTLFIQELPLKSESDKAIENLLKIGHVDVIVSHDGPRQFIMENFAYPIRDVSASYLYKTKQKKNLRVHPGFELDKIYKKSYLYDQWYFGHHHRDFSKGKIRCLMDEVVLWDLDSNIKSTFTLNKDKINKLKIN